MPNPQTDPDRYADWKKRYDGCNGIMEETYPAGTYFKFSPFDYEREIIDVSTSAAVPNDKVGIVIKKFGRVSPQVVRRIRQLLDTITAPSPS